MKIEFKVIPTCFELFEKKKLNFLGKNEFKIYNSALKNLTKEILSQKNGFLSNDIIKIKELDCLVDRSKFKRVNIIYQLPMEHNLVKINKSFYKLNDKSLIDFVIEEVNHKIKDFYFIVRGDLETLDLKEDIYTFLSIINNQII